jgi:hypothetical protein
LNLLPPPFSLIPPPISGIFSTSIIFPFTYIRTQYLQYIHHPMTFAHFFPSSSNTLISRCAKIENLQECLTPHSLVLDTCIVFRVHGVLSCIQV